MKNSAHLTILWALLLPLAALAGEWDPASSPKLKAEQPPDLLINGRAFEVFEHGAQPAWGYTDPQQDTFIMVHPKTEHHHAPLYVVLHSAGHDVYSALRCTRDIGNHDIYRSPEEFYALYLDCRAHKNDWWWGGMHRGDAKLIQRNSGGKPTPVELRVLDCIRWAIAKYNIDPNRVYLSGISMGGQRHAGHRAAQWRPVRRD
jgi:poly(3-hydroxybutyrate) depolymerase